MPRKSNTRERLLAAAHKLMWIHSYGSVTIDDICKEAKALKGSFYHYFESKVELTVAALEATWESFRPGFDRHFSSAVSGFERLKTYPAVALQEQQAVLQESGHVLGCPFSTVGSEQIDGDGRVREKVEEILKRVRRYFFAALRDAVQDGDLKIDDIDKTADELLTHLLGALVLARVYNSLTPLNALTHTWNLIIGLK